MTSDSHLCRIAIPLWALAEPRVRRIVLEAFPAEFRDSADLADILTARPLAEPESGRPGRALRLVDGHPYLVIEVADESGCMGARQHLRFGKVPYQAVIGQEGMRVAAIAIQGDEHQASMLDDAVYAAAVRLDAEGRPQVDDVQLQPVRRMEAARRALTAGFQKA